LIRNTFPGSEAFTRAIKDSLTASGVQLLGEAEGAAPNAPREDLFRIAEALIDLQPDVLISFGGGSTIDATKAAEVLRTLGGSIDDYFGTGLVAGCSQQRQETRATRGHSDRVQFCRALDQVFQHHRRFDRAEEIDRGWRTRPPASGLRLHGHV
jgi:hypothetical protein